MSRFHAVRFYDSTESISRIVAVFLGAGFLTREPAVVIARPERHSAITAALRAVSFDVAALQRTGRLVLLDAQETLDALMVNGEPDAVRFESFAATALAHLCPSGARAVRAYDEMVDLLWALGRARAALRLEDFWDRLTTGRKCSLLCGHAAGRFVQHGGEQSICAQHSHVIGDNGLPHLIRD